MTDRAHFSYAVLVFFLCTSAWAEPEMESALSLEKAVDLALVQNRELAAARFAIAQAEGRLTQAGLWPNPELELSRSTDATFSASGEYAGSAGIRQRFPISGRLAEAKNVAQKDVALARLEVRNAERLVAGDVTAKYRELLVATEKLRANDEIESSIRNLIEITRRRLKVAEVSPADLNLEEIELQKLALARVQLEVEKEATAISLNELLGRDPHFSVTPIEPLLFAVSSDHLKSALAEASRRRPDRELAALQIERAGAETELARAERWEDWTFGIGYERDKTVFDSPAISDGDELLAASVSIPLPLWNRNEGKIAEASATQKRARSELEAVDLKIAAETASAFARVQRFQEAVSRYQKQSLKLAEDNVALLRKSYQDGLVGISQVIQAQQQLREVRQAYVEAIGSLLRALTEFETATATNSHFAAQQGENLQ